MSKILLAVSERWVPDARVEAIAQYAHRLEAPILAVHVVYGTDVIYGRDSNTGETSPGERVLTLIAEQLKTVGIKADTLLLFSDDAADAIAKTAVEHQCTQVILGLATKGMLARLIEGNVAQEIIKSTRLPVLLLPPDWKGVI
jgi:nucleotide-binding universal stress UspA family protein